MPHRFVRPRVRLGKQWHEVQRPKRAEQQEHPQHEAEVADAINDERFLAGVGSRLFQKIETDEQVARKAHALPADEEQHVVRGHHQDQHEKHEQVEIGKETVVPALMCHVSGRVNVDEPAHAGNHHQHDHRKLIDLKVESRAEIPRCNPCKILLHPRNLRR